MKYLPLLLVFLSSLAVASPIGVELRPCSKKTCKVTDIVADGADRIVVSAIHGVREYPPCGDKCSMVGLMGGQQFLAVGSVLDIVCKFWPNTPQCCVKRYGELDVAP